MSVTATVDPVLQPDAQRWLLPGMTRAARAGSLAGIPAGLLPRTEPVDRMGQSDRVIE